MTTKKRRQKIARDESLSWLKLLVLGEFPMTGGHAAAEIERGVELSSVRGGRRGGAPGSVSSRVAGGFVGMALRLVRGPQSNSFLSE